MTQNARMKAPKEMATETITPESFGEGRAARRMKSICATPEEVARYHYDPLSARNNLRPGIPLADYDNASAEYDD